MILFHFFHLYGLLIGLGIVTGLWIVGKQSQFFQISPAWIDRFLLFIIVPAIIGARLYHLITDWHLYQGKPIWSLFEIWNGGIGFFGGIIGGVLGLLLAIHFSPQFNPNRKSLLQQLVTYFDLLVFGIPIAQAIGRLGNYVNKELYGLPTNLPWAIEINGVRYHPLFLYEAILNMILLSILYFLSRRKQFQPGQGKYTGIYLMGYGIIRFSLEYLRVQTARLSGLFGIVSIAQWVALSSIALGLWLNAFKPKEIVH